jgi:hypothetical protein
MTSLGYNLSSDKTCNFDGPGDLNDTVPKLGKLGNYGGHSRGHLLKTDQRGKPRPGKFKHDKRCDMGAYERQRD